MRIRYFLAAVILSAAAHAQQVPIPQGADLFDDFGDGELSLFTDLSGGWNGGSIVNAGGGLQYFGSSFALTAEVYMRRDGVIDGTTANTVTGDVGGFYFWMESGGMAWRIGDLTFRGGRLPHYDFVNSPYSLLIHGDGLTADILEITYDSGRFLYSSRWIELNHNSDVVTTVFPTGFPDRGANLKTYAVRFGDMTFGIQDAIVYAGRSFDFEYFVSPIPAYVIQDARRQTGRPWSEEGEENNIIGFFWNWARPDGWDIHTQWILDDGNLHWLNPDVFDTHQPFKMAWTAGVSRKTPSGTFSFYHAGATKYSFQTSWGLPGREYGYAYFPDVVFNLRSGAEAAIPFESMMLGYRHGENNLAFLGAWNGNAAGFDLGASLEFTVSGSKSPANAWHEDYYNPDDGTKLLNESPLEWRILAAAGVSRRVGDFLLYAGVSAGYVFNELELEDTGEIPDGHYTIDPYNRLQIWRPSDADRFLFAVTVGGRYRLRIK
ncbi:MAG TPA: hypothetical protein VLH39_04170 [Magnetospirillaceae bacterium]|nr:hypothetical protein [Magnetospirillaceae bacterium]